MIYNFYILYSLDKKMIMEDIIFEDEEDVVIDLSINDDKDTFEILVGNVNVDDLDEEEIIEEPIKEVKKKKDNFFIDNDELVEEVLACKKVGVISDKLARMLMTIAEKFSYHRYFIGYSYKEDMIADALLNLSERALLFDPEKSKNAFGYYTQAIYRSFRQYTLSERDERIIKDRMLLDLGANPSFNFQQELQELRSICPESANELTALHSSLPDIEKELKEISANNAKKKKAAQEKKKKQLDPDISI